MIVIIGLAIIVWVMYRRDKERERQLKELDNILNDYYDRREQRIKEEFKRIEDSHKLIEDKNNNK